MSDLRTFNINGIIHKINDKLSLETIYNNVHNWEQNSFKIIEHFSNKDKYFIDIGAHIGVLTIHGSSLYKHVVSVECDSEALKSLYKNINDNNITNNTIINKAIYNIDNFKLNFGGNGKKGNSMSTLLVNENKWKTTRGASWLIEHKTDGISNYEELHNDCETVDTIRLNTIFNNCNINPDLIGLIKIDIEGGEKYMFDDIIDFLTKYKPNLLLSLHYVFLNEIDCHTILDRIDKIYGGYYFDVSTMKKINIADAKKLRFNHSEILCSMNFL